MSNMMTLNNVYEKILNEKQKNIIKESDDIIIQLTNNISSEFVTTVNQFSEVCAEMVKARSIKKETYQNFKDLIKKMENLIEASIAPEK